MSVEGGGGAGEGRGAVLGWPEIFRGSQIAASKCKGSRRQGSPQETPGREGGESAEGARVGEGEGEGVGVGDPLSSSDKISVNKGLGEERLKIW